MSFRQPAISVLFPALLSRKIATLVNEVVIPHFHFFYSATGLDFSPLHSLAVALHLRLAPAMPQGRRRRCGAIASGVGLVALVMLASVPVGRRAALTQKLEDVFAAPLDALAGYVHRVEERAPGASLPPVGVAGTDADTVAGASVRIDGPVCGGVGQPRCDEARTHLGLEVFCPPYKAPDHGSVWYKGKRYTDVTAPAPSSRVMITLPGSVGPSVPAAVLGVDIPAGDHVQVECDDHYQLTRAGTEFPKCLESGQFDEGKRCEPIMCSAYRPPAHGGVWPDSPVQAGTSVEVYCFEGYEEDYDDFWPFQKAVPRAEFDAHGRRKDAGAAVATAAVVAASPTGTDRGAQTKLTSAATAPSGGAARRARAVLLARAALRRLQRLARFGGGSPGRGRVRRPDVRAFERAVAAARRRRRKEDRGRLPPQRGLPVCVYERARERERERGRERGRGYMYTCERKREYMYVHAAKMAYSPSTPTPP